MEKQNQSLHKYCQAVMENIYIVRAMREKHALAGENAGTLTVRAIDFSCVSRFLFAASESSNISGWGR